MKRYKEFFWILVVFFIMILLVTPYGILGGHHGFLSTHGLALSKSLHMSKPFLMYNGSEVGGMYNRFPSITFWLIKFSAGLYDPYSLSGISAARNIMTMFFAASGAILYCAMRELKFGIISSTLSVIVAYGSFIPLYYSDMLFSDVPTLFGFTLFLWSFANYLNTRNSLTLCISGIIGVSFGWQMAFSIFFILAFYHVFLKDKSDNSRTGLCIFVIFASFIIFNSLGVLSEVLVSGGSPSFDSFLSRVGNTGEIDAKYESQISWASFVYSISQNFINLFIPYVIGFEISKLPQFLILIIAFALVALAMFRIRANYKLLAVFIGTFLGVILYYALFRRFVLFHDFQMIYMVPLVAFCCICLFKSLDEIKFAPLVIFIGILTFFFSYHKVQVFKMINTTNTAPVLYSVRNIDFILGHFDGIPVQVDVSPDNFLFKGFAPYYFFSIPLNVSSSDSFILKISDHTVSENEKNIVRMPLPSASNNLNIFLNMNKFKNFLMDHGRIVTANYITLAKFAGYAYLINENCATIPSDAAYTIAVDGIEMHRLHSHEWFNFTNNFCIYRLPLAKQPVNTINVSSDHYGAIISLDFN